MRTLSHIRRWQSTHEQNKYYVIFCYTMMRYNTVLKVQNYFSLDFIKQNHKVFLSVSQITHSYKMTQKIDIYASR